MRQHELLRVRARDGHRPPAESVSKSESGRPAGSVFRADIALVVKRPPLPGTSWDGDAQEIT
jgi:hypothetical protein